MSALLTTTSNAEARLKYYRYNANIPMVEMTLNMMVAMGVLEPIPGRLVYDGNPYNRFINTQYGRYAGSPYALPVNSGYVDNFGYDGYWGRAINPYTGYAGGPFAYRDPFSAWGDLPGSWGSPQGGSAWNDPWGDPWYNTWGSPRSSVYGSQWASPWSDPWSNRLNSPWMGAWNNRWDQGWNSPWVSPWSSTLINPYVNPYGAAAAWPRVPGDVSMLAPRSYLTPGVVPPQFSAPGGSLPVNPSQGAMTPGYQSQGAVTPLYPQQGAFPPGYPQQGTVTPSYPQQGIGTPGYTQQVIPGYPQQGTLTPGSRPQGVLTPSYLAPGNSATAYSPPGYAPGSTSPNSYQNPAASSVGDQNRQVYPPNRPQAPPAGQFTINNISTGDDPAVLGELGLSVTDAKPVTGQESRRSTLNGLWIGDSGEMLGIRGDSFLWYDGKNGYTNGQLLTTPRMLRAKIAGSGKELSLRYRLIEDELFTVSQDGTLRVFSRTPLMQTRPTANELQAMPSSYQSGAVGMNSGAVAARPFAAHTKSASGLSARYQKRQGLTDMSHSAHMGSTSRMWGQVASPTNASVLSDGPEPPAARPDTLSAKADATEHASAEHTLRKNTDELTATLNSPSSDAAWGESFVNPDVNNTSASAPRDASSAQFGNAPWYPAAPIQLSAENAEIWKPLTPFAEQPLGPAAASVDALGRQDAGNRGVFFMPALPAFPGDQSHWTQERPASAPPQDPEWYLYSYIRGPQRPGQVSAPRMSEIDDSNIWRPSAAYLEKGHKGFPGASEKSKTRGNIWKPSWPLQDRDAGLTGLETFHSSETAASAAQDRDDANVRKFFWAESTGW